MAKRKNLADLAHLRVSHLCQLGEHSGHQFILRPQQELDCAEPLHHILQYICPFDSTFAHNFGQI